MNNDTTEIVALLSQIRGAIYLVGSLVVVWVILISIRAFSVWKHEGSKRDNTLRDEAEELLEKGEDERLISLALGKLKDRPKHILAHWYLARGFYMQEKWKAALNEFETTRQLCPTWGQTIDQWVAEIQRRQDASIKGAVPANSSFNTDPPSAGRLT